MAKEEAKGVIWFTENYCKKCTAHKNCVIDTIVCIEAEKLRFLRTGCLDVSTGEL